MKAGDLDRRVTFLRATTAPNDLNELIETWAPLATVWAGVTPASDGERLRAQQVGAYITARFLIRYSALAATITALDRILYEGRIYGISGKKEIGRREGFEVTAAGEEEQLTDEEIAAIIAWVDGEAPP